MELTDTRRGNGGVSARSAEWRLEMYKRKYRIGRLIITFECLMHALDTVGFVYINDKILHKGWVLGLQLRYLVNAFGAGLVRTAIKNEI